MARPKTYKVREHPTADVMRRYQNGLCAAFAYALWRERRGEGMLAVVHDNGPEPDGWREPDARCHVVLAIAGTCWDVHGAASVDDMMDRWEADGIQLVDPDWLWDAAIFHGDEDDLRNATRIIRRFPGLYGLPLRTGPATHGGRRIAWSPG